MVFSTLAIFTIFTLLWSTLSEQFCKMKFFRGYFTFTTRNFLYTFKAFILRGTIFVIFIVVSLTIVDYCQIILWEWILTLTILTYTTGSKNIETIIGFRVVSEQPRPDRAPGVNWIRTVHYRNNIRGGDKNYRPEFSRGGPLNTMTTSFLVSIW